jgi:putative Holliday junction resolvase
MTYLGIDYGKKRIGLSVSDEGGTFAFPFVIIANDRDAFSKIETIVSEKNIGHLVVGVPKPGGDLDQTTVRTWAEDFSSRLKIPVSFQDETLTSHFASGKLVDTSRLADSRDRMNGKTESSPDALAAALILQRFLDKKTR